MKIKKAIKGLVEILKNPWLLNHVVNSDVVWERYIAQKHGLKHTLPVVDLNLIVPNFSESLNCFAFLDGGSLPTDIALLKSLARRFEHCRYFEIGTWRGESVVNVADVAQECYTLNLPKSDILSLGLGEKYADLHGFFSKSKSNIIHLTGNSMDFDFENLNKKFDLIFIDGNHHYDFVKNDTQKVFQHLVHDDSIVVWHDYAYNPEKIRPEVFAAILDGAPQENRPFLYHVSNTMCAIFLKQQFPTKLLDAPEVPDKTFRIRVECSSLKPEL